MKHRIELIPRQAGEHVELLSPTVGLFTAARVKGRILTPGESAGTIKCLLTGYQLVVPRGVSGRIVSSRPERVHKPVGYGTPLYELAPLSGEPLTELTPGRSPEATGTGPVLRSPHSGRFWHRPAPGEDPLLRAGDEVHTGQPIGLIEVMKTFTHVPYGGDDLPAQARAVRLLAEDGAEISKGDPLLEVEDLG